MTPAGRFQYIVVATNPATGERFSAGAASPKTLTALVSELRATGFTDIHISETVRREPEPSLVLWPAITLPSP